MAGVPRLTDLCIAALADELIRGDDNSAILSFIHDLPSELFDDLLPRLPPVILQKLEESLPFNSRDYVECAYGSNREPHKRRKLAWKVLDTAWHALNKVRWPCINRLKQGVGWLDKHEETQYNSTDDWQQIYWEAHLQDCLDAIAETALLPSYDGSIGEIQIPDVILEHIGCKGHPDYLKFSYHCQRFGLYARRLRLPNALCVAEICDLLHSSKLHTLELQWIKSSDHVEGLCKLLNQNCDTLKSVEFLHCKLSPSFINAICDSLHVKDLQLHGVEHFSVKRSSFLQPDSSPIPKGLTSFLKSGRNLQSLILSDDQLGRNSARVIFNTLLEAPENISTLDLSENDISGFLSQFRWRSSNCSLAIGKSLQSLRVLNLRLCTLISEDADCLKQALVHMPNLQNLDISDNLIENGLRGLITYFSEICNRDLPFLELKLENCELTFNQVVELLQVLSTMKKPLNLLSLKGNNLGSKIGASLGKFLCTGISALDVEDIGLGFLGFRQALEEIMENSKMIYINISNNHGGIEAANFIVRLISHAKSIVAIDSRFNLMPMESLSVISSGLKASKVKLKHLDLTGNSFCDQLAADGASGLDEFQINGQFNLLLAPAPYLRYDDDP